ncbi:MAG TPA: hypothetical protein VFA89_03375 [Terriglobales bacterium]|nr:hypothetical protein [Terriglobales bacterium]
MSAQAKALVRRNIFYFACFALACVLLGPCAAAQPAPYERTFPLPKADVENALRSMQAYSGGRLPVLEGFVESGEQSLDSFGQPFYQYSIKLTAISPNETLVRVTAKVTAWFSSEDGSHSGYRTISSNGRLEADLFDRLNQALKTNVATQSKPATGQAADANGSEAVKDSAVTTQALTGPTTTESARGSSANAEAGSNSSAAALPNAASSAKAASVFRSPAPGTASLNAENVAPKVDEIARDKRILQLRDEAKSLQQVLDHQSKPDDLAVVKESRTPVLSRPAERASVLLMASAEDEFQVLKVSGDWVHVQMTGAARGWIRRKQLDLSTVSARLLADDATPVKVDASPGPVGSSTFQQTKEETATFPGDWQPLKGKKVKIVWVQASDNAKSVTGESRATFVKSVFRKEFPGLSRSVPDVAGVVIVFDEADGGMAAATVATLEQLNSGKLSDAAFWQQCWMDPPEAFRKSASR